MTPAVTPILDGIRVVDLTQYLAGPTVTRLMAEMGADIVKVEQAPGGDPTRGYAVAKDGRSGYFVQQNRGKRSLCVDLDRPEGQDLVRALIDRADVVVENYGPGVLARRGLDHESLLPTRPRLIYASLSAFGRTGPYAGKTGFDLIAQAFSGLAHMTGPPDGPPMWVGSSIADVTTGVHVCAAVGYALFHRERTGRGQFVDVSMVDSMFHQHEVAVQGPPLTDMRWRPKRSGHHSGINAPHGMFKGPQGWIAILVMERQWPSMARAMGRPDLITDPRFEHIRERGKHGAELAELIEAWMATFPTDDEVLAVLEEHRVPAAPVLEPRDAIGHPYYEARGMVRRVPDSILGEVTIPGTPFNFSEMPERLELLAPLLGEHNVEVLGELGVEAAEVERLHAEGVLVRGDR